MENIRTEVGAVLLDTRSIQKYVFGCNELKTNVGASYIVDKIFEEIMCGKVLKEYTEASVETGWKKNPEIKMLKEAAIEYEVAYIGGGNMLILVHQAGKTLADDIKECRNIVKKWSKKVLLDAPGLKTGAAIGALDITEAGFKKSLDALYKQLKENQNKILPDVDLPYTGLTKECDVSGKTADTYDYSHDKKRMVSSEVKAKISAQKDAECELEAKLKAIYPDVKLAFEDEFEKIGYVAGESYLSVIHIDGNNMGVKFSCCKNLQKRKELSLKVQQSVEKAFESLVKKIVSEFETYKDYLDYKKLTDGAIRSLPIRPIIIGGDDITFVCPGRLGIEFAKYFVEEAAKETIIDDADLSAMEEEANKDNNGPRKKINKRLSCCAGVAIVPAKYPFFRAYGLAEQLCSAAKKKSRTNDDSWLDFAILHGEMTPELQQLRDEQYVSITGKKLHFGPYQIADNGVKENSIDRLLNLAKRLDDESARKTILEKKAARNKVKKLREVLCGDMHGITRFLENAADIEAVLKEETAKREVSAQDFFECVSGSKEEATIFIDAIEIIDFLPKKKDR